MKDFRKWFRRSAKNEQTPLQPITPETQKPPSIEIRKAAVIGAGVMGKGIAGQLANAGIEVVLLDKFPGAADKAVQTMIKARPDKDPMNAGLMSPKNAKLITTGTTDDNMDLIADADWIVEVVPEILDLKRNTFAAIEKHRKPGAIVSSNTSTIPLSVLAEGRSNDFKQHFVISHFFNPVRFMKLLEIVGGPETKPEVLKVLQDCGDIRLGKSVVVCKDTPGFIGNRIGTYCLQRAINETFDRGLKIEDVDAVLGAPMGFPKDGVFGLVDIVGLDVAPKVLKSLHTILPETDAFQSIYRESALIEKMIADGYTGRKGKGGFYRRQDGKKQALDLETGEYRDAEKVSLPRRKLPEIFESDKPADRLAWRVMRDTLHYTLSLVPEIADDITAIDEAMRGGYNWKRGPFEIIDQLGPDWLAAKFEADGLSVPPLLEAAKGKSFYRVHESRKEVLTPEGTFRAIPAKGGVLDLADIKRTSKPVLKNASASLWDIGDGVLCIELHSQLNAMDQNIFGLLNETMDLVQSAPDKYKALVVYNDGPHFSYGANLLLAAETINHADWESLDDMLFQGQETYRRLRYLPVPVVAAVRGMALGGGCELPLHSDAVQAHAETYMGLVEAGVGFIPAWGGCTRFLGRCVAAASAKGPMPPVKKAFETIATGTYSSSAQDAMEKLFMREGIDGISMNGDRLLGDAKARALSLVPGYKPPEPFIVRLPGASGKATLGMGVDNFRAAGLVTFHDVVVADALATVLTGADTNATKLVHENELYRLEREQFSTLVKTTETRARLKHMLTTRKPLREPPLVLPRTANELRAGKPAPFTGPQRNMPYPPFAAQKQAATTTPEKDLSAMKPMDAIIHLLIHDDWTPETNLPPDLSDVFHKAAADTRGLTLQMIRDNKGMAALMPRKQQIGFAERYLGEQIGKNEEKLAAAGADKARKAELSGRIAMYRHFQDRFTQLKVS